MLGQKQRLNRVELATIAQKGSSLHSPIANLRYLISQHHLPHPKFAITVSSKVSKKATNRNSLRRRLHQTIQQHQEKIYKNIKLQIILKPPSIKLDPKTLEAEILKLLKKANLLALNL